jgi:uncharacterized repeat protein (TIGR03803 family)
MDKAGNLYGTASLGGYEKGICHLPDSPVGCGTVFKIDTAGTFSELVKFDSADGNYPGPLMEDTHGTIFGTTALGGRGCCGGGGVVYKLTASDKESVLYKFNGTSDGQWPIKVVEDTKGNLYGTTIFGGDLSYGCGVVFELTRETRNRRNDEASHTLTSRSFPLRNFASSLRPLAGCAKKIVYDGAL